VKSVGKRMLRKDIKRFRIAVSVTNLRIGRASLGKEKSAIRNPKFEILK
jgi:hypothetical protein